MGISFIAFLNKAGIACASDSDHTIYNLSKKEPLAVAVNPHSPISWDKIINDYIKLGEPEHHNSLSEYLQDFGEFLSKVQTENKWKNISDYDRKIVFMGYGTDDIFPSVQVAYIEFRDENGMHMFASPEPLGKITHENSANISMIGDFDSVSPIIYGVNEETKNFFVEKQIQNLDEYKMQIAQKVKGTEFEDDIKAKLDAFNTQNKIKSCTDSSSENIKEEIYLGIGTFSIEDMVTATENLVNANNRLSHLRSGCKEPAGFTKEIAVITRVEGLTWIKHSLFAI